MKVITLLFILIFNFVAFSQEIIINEVSSINSTAWMDENYENPDWIELKNISSSDVNLKNYRISDKDKYDKAWVLPDTILKPNEVILLSASDGAYNSSGKYVIETGGVGIVPGYDEDGFTYLYMEYEGDFVAEFDFTSMRNVGMFGAAGITFKEELTDEAKYFGVYNLQRDRYSYALMRRTEVGKGTEVDYSYHHNINPWGLIRLERTGNTIIAYDIENGYDWREFARFEASFKGKGYIGLGFTTSKMTEIGKFTFSSFKLNGEAVSIDSFNHIDIDVVEPSRFYKSNEIHTDFKLSRSGETITLWDADGNIEHSLEVPAQNVDISYARKDNGQMLLSYPATPGLENKNFYNGRCDIPILETNGGFFDSAKEISFEIKSGETIYYTLNGDEPTNSSKLYSSPFTINHTTVVRAKAFATGKLPSKTLTRTFFIDDQYTLPVVSMATDSLNIWDPEKGLFSEPNLYWPNDKLGHFEIWNKDGQLEMYSDGTMRLHGQRSRRFEQKSIRFHANAISDSTDYSHPFFGNGSYKKYEKILFRNGGTGWTSAILTDAFAHQILAKIPDLTTSRYRAAISYLNGKFYGLVNMREKVDEDLLAEQFDISEESVNFAEDDLSAGNGTSGDFYSDLTDIMAMDMNSDQAYQFVADNFDLDNLYSYLASQIFICNIDWPWKNVKYWMSEELDGKWRFLPHDMDYTFGCSAAAWEFDIFKLLKDDQFYPNFIRKLWENQKIKDGTINRICDLMNSVFLPENTKPVLEKMILEIKDYIELQHNTYEESADLWAHSMDRMRAFADRRAFRLREHMYSYFNCGDSALVHLDVNDNTAGYIKLNSLTVNEFPWNGFYFSGVPITVEAVANPGHNFLKWSNPKYGNNPKITVNPEDAMTLFAIYDVSAEPKAVVINEIMYKAAENHDTGDWIELYNPNDESVDLSFWALTDSNPDNIYTFPTSTILDAKSYIVITRNGDDFEKYHNDIDYLDNMEFGLSDDDAVKLYSINGELVDSVDYNSKIPWPTEADGTGASIELVKPERDNSLGVNWKASLNLYGTPGRKNSIDTGVTVDSKKQFRVFPNPVSTYISVRANGMDLWYRIIDKTGKIVLEGNFSYATTINTQNLSIGSYILEVLGDGMRKSLPIVVVR